MTIDFKNYISKEHDLTAFFEIIQPPVSVIIIGAGNDVMPLVDMADILGWETTVVDGRANYAKKERFASACQVLVSKTLKVFIKNFFVFGNLNSTTLPTTQRTA